ncbi:MAG: response regulator, partial [Betaproteobacteria bacterium]
QASSDVAAYDLAIRDWQSWRKTTAKPRGSTGRADPPELPTILMVSAFEREARTRQTAAFHRTRVLVKPCLPSVLFDTIVDLLGDTNAVEPDSDADAWQIQADPMLRGARVLVAEDNELNRLVVEQLLTRAGIDVTFAHDGRAAVALTQQRVFDAVLMDIQMPGMDGYEASRSIRQRSAAAEHLPIIAMTANAMPGDREKCLQAGMDDYLVKPIDQDVLFNVLKTWIGKSRPTAKSAATALADAVALPALLPGIDLAAGLHRAGSRAVQRKLLRAFYRDHRQCIEVLRQQLKRGELSLARHDANTLQSMAVVLGASTLQAAAAELHAVLQSGARNEYDARLATLEQAFNPIIASLEALFAATDRAAE